MTTDEERREVAHNIRENYVRSGLGYKVASAYNIAMAIGMNPGILVGDIELWNRLADLIEPHRGSGERSILCAHCENASWCGCESGDEDGGCDFEPSVTEGEPPYNLYSLYEVIFRRHPRDEYAIEDDEVEELVDALLDICNAPGHDVIQRPQPSCARSAGTSAPRASMTQHGT